MLNNSSKIILVVDDSTDNQDLLSTLLVASGYQVYCASNGREALSLLSELIYLPDLILLDAQMPIMDGYQFRFEQNKNPRLKNIPVVIMTADSDLEVFKKMISPKGVLIKPLDIRSLVDNVVRYS